MKTKYNSTYARIILGTLFCFMSIQIFAFESPFRLATPKEKITKKIIAKMKKEFTSYKRWLKKLEQEVLAERSELENQLVVYSLISDHELPSEVKQIRDFHHDLIDFMQKLDQLQKTYIKDTFESEIKDLIDPLMVLNQSLRDQKSMESSVSIFNGIKEINHLISEMEDSKENKQLLRKNIKAEVVSKRYEVQEAILTLAILAEISSDYKYELGRLAVKSGQFAFLFGIQVLVGSLVGVISIHEMSQINIALANMSLSLMTSILKLVNI